MKLLPWLAALLLCVMTAACKSRPDTVLDEERMARLMADLELADAMCIDQGLGQFASDSMKMALRSSVLAKHGINEATLDTCLRWYGANLPEYLKVIDRADSILADSMRALERDERLKLMAMAGDSTNVWPLAPSAVFARNQPGDFLAFELEADSTWKRGDIYTLDLALHNARSPLSATLVVDYANRGRTSDAVAMSLYPADKRHLNLKLQLDSNINARRIYGYITLPAAPGERAFADSIKLMRTRLVSNEYNEGRRYTRRITRNAL